ncbi:MAG: hypothetical protein J6V66_01535 [Clostridia bacterium]|nr:hypothetical protein [Clostridia bacterium]
MSNLENANLENLYEAVLKLKSKEDCRKFFEDICTIKEVLDLSQRLEVASLLSAGKNYQEVVKLTGASTATISRVSRCINYGAGGYKIVLDESKENING